MCFRHTPVFIGRYCILCLHTLVEIGYNGRRTFGYGFRAFYKDQLKMAKKELVPTTKSGIIAALAAAGEINKKQAAAVYAKLLDIAVKGAKQEEKGLMLPGFGKVKLVKRPARIGRNPATGEQIKIKAKKVVKVVACKALKDAILG